MGCWGIVTPLWGYWGVTPLSNIVSLRARDQRNRELFERTFPELKLRREQQERLMRYIDTHTHTHNTHTHTFSLSVCLLYRVDQRGYGIVRSELELSQVMCELIEQEEVRKILCCLIITINPFVTGTSTYSSYSCLDSSHGGRLPRREIVFP